MDMLDQLREAGLAGRQADVYLALLQLGGSTVLEVAARAGVKRTTAYDILARLRERHLVTESSRGRRRLFVARDPEALLQLPRDQEQLLTALLPQLLSFHNEAPRKPRVQLFEGAEGVRRANDLLLSLGVSEYHYFGSQREMMDLLGEKYLHGFVKRRIAKGIWSNAIRVAEDELKNEFMSAGAERLRRVRYFPGPLPGPIAVLYIAGDHAIVSSSRRESYALSIQSADLARLLLVIWRLVWSTARQRLPPAARGLR